MARNLQWKMNTNFQVPNSTIPPNFVQKYWVMWSKSKVRHLYEDIFYINQPITSSMNENKEMRSKIYPLELTHYKILLHPWRHEPLTYRLYMSLKCWVPLVWRTESNMVEEITPALSMLPPPANCDKNVWTNLLK